MMKRLALAHVALLVAWPATAQVATVPVGSLMQTSTTTATLTLAVSLHGKYTATTTASTALLPNQTVKLAPLALLQPEISAEFPVTKTSMTVTELVVWSTIQTATSQTSAETRAQLPSPGITVPAAQRLKVVYSVPAGQQGQLRFYVGAPTPPAGAAPSGTRISQIGQRFIDSAGNEWSLGPRTDGGPGLEILRKGKPFGHATELVWQNAMIYALNGGSWWKIGPLDASTLDWQRLTSGPTARPDHSPTSVHRPPLRQPPVRPARLRAAHGSAKSGSVSSTPPATNGVSARAPTAALALRFCAKVSRSATLRSSFGRTR